MGTVCFPDDGVRPYPLTLGEGPAVSKDEGPADPVNARIGKGLEDDLGTHTGGISHGDADDG
jgi:hypothetical protein